MALLGLLYSPRALLALPIWLVLYYALPYFTTYRYLARVPDPLVAKFSNIWVGLGARQGKKFARVDSAHRRYGKLFVSGSIMCPSLMSED